MDKTISLVLTRAADILYYSVVEELAKFLFTYYNVYHLFVTNEGNLFMSLLLILVEHCFIFIRVPRISFYIFISVFIFI